MPRPEVVNFYTMGAWREGDVYVGRRTPKVVDVPGADGAFGNPFVINQLHDRSAVVLLFEEALANMPALVERLAALKPKRLVCYCAPKDCHGYVYADRLEALDGVNP